MRHSRISSQYIRAAQSRGRDLSRIDRSALPRRMSNRDHSRADGIHVTTARSYVGRNRRRRVLATPELVGPDCNAWVAEEFDLQTHCQAKPAPSRREEVPAMLRRVEPHSHDLLGRRVIPSTPGEILADGVSA